MIVAVRATVCNILVKQQDALDKQVGLKIDSKQNAMELLGNDCERQVQDGL